MLLFLLLLLLLLLLLFMLLLLILLLLPLRFDRSRFVTEFELDGVGAIYSDWWPRRTPESISDKPRRHNRRE